MEVTIKETKHVSAFKAATPPVQNPPSDQPPPPPPIPPTAEELAARASDVATAMGWEPPKPAPAAPEPAAPAAPAPEPPKPEPSPEPKAPAPPSITMDDQPTHRRPQAAFKASAPPFELSAEDARDYPVLCFMAFKNKEKHGKLPEQYLAFVKKLYDYMSKWEAEHPGEPFDAEDKEHTAIYAEQPQIDPAELDEARIDMKVEERVRPLHEEREAETEQQREQKLFEKYKPTIEFNLSKQVVTMVDEVDPGLGKFLRDAKGNYRITPEAEADVEAADPIAKPILAKINEEELIPIMVELERLGIPGTKYRLNPRSNPIHELIADYNVRAEKAILDLPAEDQIFDGRQFVTQARLAEMRNEIMRGEGTAADKSAKVEALDGKYYTLTIDDLQETIRDAMVEKAKRLIGEANARAEKKYGKREEKPPVTAPAPRTVAPPAPPQPEPQRPAPTPVSSVSKPRPPSLSSGADVTPNPPGVTPNDKSFGRTAVDVAFK